MSTATKKSVYIAIVTFILFSSYLTIRRGYFNMYIINKVFGSTAVMLAAITLLIWPLSREFAGFARFMPMRRPLGLIAAGAAGLHVILSIVVLSSRFPLTWFIEHWIPIAFGVVAVTLWGYLMSLSNDAIEKKLGPEQWRKIQSIVGRIAFVSIFLHLTILKYSGWIRWWNGQVNASADLKNPGYPPASIFVFFIMLAVMIYRIVLHVKSHVPVSPKAPEGEHA